MLVKGCMEEADFDCKLRSEYARGGSLLGSRCAPGEGQGPEILAVFAISQLRRARSSLSFSSKPIRIRSAFASTPSVMSLGSANDGVCRSILRSFVLARVVTNAWTRP